MSVTVYSDAHQDADNRRHPISRTSTVFTSSQGHYDRHASLPRRLNSTASENRSLLQPSTESGHSFVSSMLYITSSQCASPSFGPVFPPRSDANTNSTKRRAHLSIVAEEFDGGVARMLQDMALSEPLPDPEDIPTRGPLYQNDTFEPQVLSYDLEQEHQQDAPLPYRRFAYDRDITPGEWSTLQEHVLALWNGGDSLTQARNAELETRTRVDEWNARFFSSRGMLLVLFAGNVAKGGSLSGWKETKIEFKTFTDQDTTTQEREKSNFELIDSLEVEGEAGPSVVPSGSRSPPYALVMYDLQRSWLPGVLQDARASRAPGFFLPWMDSPPTRKALPKRQYPVSTKPYNEKATPQSAAVPSTARANAERIFYSLATDRNRVIWKVDSEKALPDAGITLVDRTLWPFLQRIFLSAFYQENHLEPRLGSETGRRMVVSISLSIHNSMFSHNAMAKLRAIDDPTNDPDLWGNLSLYSILYSSGPENILKPCYYCYICMLQFPRSSMDDMLAHIRKHLGHRPYVCNCHKCTLESGTSRFHSEKALIQHQEEARRIAVGRQDFQSGPNAYAMPTFKEELRNSGDV